MKYILVPILKRPVVAIGPFDSKQEAREFRDRNLPDFAPIAMVPPEELNE